VVAVTGKQVDGMPSLLPVGNVKRTIIALVPVWCVSRICIASLGSQAGTQPAAIAPPFSASARVLYVASIVSEQAPRTMNAGIRRHRRSERAEFMMPNV
jgi:hypothetical protein